MPAHLLSGKKLKKLFFLILAVFLTWIANDHSVQMNLFPEGTTAIRFCIWPLCNHKWSQGLPKSFLLLQEYTGPTAIEIGPRRVKWLWNGATRKDSKIQHNVLIVYSFKVAYSKWYFEINVFVIFVIRVNAKLQKKSFLLQKKLILFCELFQL